MHKPFIFNFCLLLQIQTLELPFLNVNCKHLSDFDIDLYRQLVSYPQEVIQIFDMAANEMFFERYPDTTLEHQVQVRTYNTDKTKNMRSLNPEGESCTHLSSLPRISMALHPTFLNLSLLVIGSVHGVGEKTKHVAMSM